MKEKEKYTMSEILGSADDLFEEKEKAKKNIKLLEHKDGQKAGGFDYENQKEELQTLEEGLSNEEKQIYEFEIVFLFEHSAKLKENNEVQVRINKIKENFKKYPNLQKIAKLKYQVYFFECANKGIENIEYARRHRALKSNEFKQIFF